MAEFIEQKWYAAVLYSSEASEGLVENRISLIKDYQAVLTFSHRRDFFSPRTDSNAMQETNP